MSSLLQASASSSPTAEQEFLAFTLGQEEYGINLHNVQELRGYETVTQLANTPAYLKGVLNLRGTIVPIVDMRIKLNLGEPVYDQFTVVIVLNIRGRTMGIVVDGVSDVVALAADQLRPAPQMGVAVATDHLFGLGVLDDRMLILLDIDRLVDADALGLVEKFAA
ncbi:MAG TPA: chemotaxis protein CheW [Oxalicibacterium sp.]|nr:chemotaxis protein CheW [Oxalicibacterium sp.]